MGRCCAVHGCVSGRKASKSVRKVALFKAPKDVELRSKWSSALGQELKATSFICEFHFNPEDVIKRARVIWKDGSISTYEYERVHLKTNAEPKSNIINGSNDDNNSLLSDNELSDTFDIIDHTIIGDRSHNSVQTVYEYQKVHSKKKAEPKSNIINDSNDDNNSLLSNNELSDTSDVIDHTIIDDCSLNSVETEYEYQKVHSKKKAEPKSNIINDSNDNSNSLLSDNELSDTFDIIDHTIIGDRSHNSVQTVYEYQKVHSKKKAEPKSNIINDSNDDNNSLLSNNELSDTSDVIDHTIIDDCSLNSVETEYEYQKVHSKKKAEPKSNIINDSNDNSNSLLSDNELSDTSDIIDHTIIGDCSLNSVETEHEYQIVHSKKKAEPKSNIINDSNDNSNSLLTDNELSDTCDIIDHTIIGDCSLNSVETSPVHEIKNEEIEPENINCANTNFPDGANTATENDNLLVKNETEEFSFHSFEEILKAQPLGKNWSWTVIKNSFISLSCISSKLELVCHVKIDMDLNVTIINAKTNMVIDMDVYISSIACIWQLLKHLEKSFFCTGTGYDDQNKRKKPNSITSTNNTTCSVTCTGIILPEDRYRRRVVEYRCVTCRKLRRLIQIHHKRKTTNNEARWMKFKHRYILQRRKLNRVVNMNKNLKQRLLDLKNQCAVIKEEVLSEKNC